MAALLGALPLMLQHGTGSELRRPLGFTMVGGLILSQAMTLFTTPVVYLYLDRFTGVRRRQRSSEHAHPSGQTPLPALSPGMSQGLSQ